jgi:prepilin peptidase CpaA
MLRLESLPELAALAVSLAGCFTDLRTRRIPNTLTFSAAVAAIVFHLLVNGPQAAAMSVAGWFVGVLLFAPFFVVGGLGAGDLKLLGAVGAWLGPWPALWVALYTAIAGGVLAIVVALSRGYARTAFSNIWFIVTSWRLGVTTVPGMTLEESSGPKLAYALPIALGTGVTIWLR